MAEDLNLKGAIIDVASTVVEPVTGKSLLDAHVLEEVSVEDGIAQIKLLFPRGYQRQHRWEVEDKVSEVVGRIEGVREVRVNGFIEGHDAAAAPGAESAPAEAHAGAAAGPAAGPAVGAPKAKGASTPNALSGVGRVIAVASGKGGVGKSTVAVNLALALKKLGFSVGLLDVDVYGPSLPTLLGINQRPTVQDKRIIPLQTAGLKLMSLGFLMEDDTPVIWRGPIVTGIIRQFLQDVDWAGTDYLIVDMPPGTGDAQLSLAQTVPVDGAIVVTTPSDLALVDAARGLKMFKTLNVDVLGIVENMSWYEWPGTAEVREAIDSLKGVKGAEAAVRKLEGTLGRNQRAYIFGQGGGRSEAKRLETEFLGEIPLDYKIRKGGDEGKPVMLAEPDSVVSRAFVELAQRLVEAKPLEGSAAPKKKGFFSFLKS